MRLFDHFAGDSGRDCVGDLRDYRGGEGGGECRASIALRKVSHGLIEKRTTITNTFDGG